jgi:hypothetical protein
MVSMGDINLQHLRLDELQFDNRSGVVSHQLQGRRYVRRLYSAKVGGQEVDMTVAMYQGEGADEVR